LRKQFFPYHLQFPCITVSALNVVPFKATFNLKIKKSASTNQGSRVDGVTCGSLVSQKLADDGRRIHLCIDMQKILGACFLKLISNVLHLSDQSLNHLFIKVTICSLFSWHKFVMNDVLSIKKYSQHCFQMQFLHSYYLSPSSNLLCHLNTLVLDGHSSPYAFFNISVVASFNSTQTYDCSLFHFETFDTAKKLRLPEQF
jgi:hypothetical protein